MNTILETVCTVCNNIRHSSKQGVSFQKLLLAIRKEFKQHQLDVRLKSTRKKFLNSEEFYVNAYYDPEDDADGETPIEVIIYHNFDKVIVWDYKHVSELLTEIFDAVVHEYKHQRQSKKRKHKEYWDKTDGRYHFDEYLADPDEIDAYALSIAIELCRTLGKHRALRYMPKFTTLARLKVQGRYVSPNLNAYIAHFDKPISPLLRRLAKKIYIRLQKVDTDFIFV